MSSGRWEKAWDEEADWRLGITPHLLYFLENQCQASESSTARQCGSSVPWEVTRLCCGCLPASVLSLLVFPHICSFSSSSNFSFSLYLPPSLFGPLKFFNFYSGVLSLVWLLYFFYHWSLVFEFPVLALDTGRREVESGFLVLEMPSGNTGCIGEGKLRMLSRSKEPKVDIPLWLRKAMVTWLYASRWDLPSMSAFVRKLIMLERDIPGPFWVGGFVASA